MQWLVNMALKQTNRTYTGRYYQFGWKDQSQTIYEDWQLNNVVNSPGIDHPYETAHARVSGSLLNGVGGFNTFTNTLSAMYSLNPSNSIPADTIANMSIRAMAATNPARAQVLLPTFLWELRELPAMLLQAGRVASAIQNNAPWRNHVDWSRPSSVASANLAYQFGWAPLVRDILNIAKLGDMTNKRLDELERLTSPKGLRRRFQISDVTRETGPKSVPVWSTGGYVLYTTERTVQSLNQWAVINWKPIPNSPYLQNPLKRMPDDIRKLLLQGGTDIRMLLLGTSGHHALENIWEALPWSWLVDWFIPIQAAIAAKNRALARPIGGVICTQRRTRVMWAPQKDGSVTLSSGTFETIRKRRVLLALNALPTASIPILNWRQSSVLGSLAVLRAR